MAADRQQRLQHQTFVSLNCRMAGFLFRTQSV